MKSSLLIVWFILCATASGLPLSKTKVQMNWKEFQELSTQKVDTLLITPKSQPPVGVIFENSDIAITLSDSTGAGTVTLTYVILSESEWVEKVIFPSTTTPLSEIITANGDAVIPTDSGYVLIAKGRTNGKSRSLTLKWHDNASFRQGVRSFPLVIPRVSTGSVTITAPQSFSNIEFSSATLISRTSKKGNEIYRYSFPRNSVASVRYTAPVQVIETKDTVIDTTPVIRETQITSSQETIHFISHKQVMAISELQLTVNHSPITKFAIAIPEGFDILAIEGNGINRWNMRDSLTVDVELTFELSGKYHLNITGEFDKDSLYKIEPLSVLNAAREKGTVAIALEGAGEAHFTSLEQGTPLPRNRFIAQMSAKLRKSTRHYKKSIKDILLSAEFTSTDFRSTVITRRHEPAKVTNAVVDSAEIFTALTKEYKSITTARYFVRQRNRQFIELSLPAGCELWSVLVNGTEVTPYMDKEGGVKIPLQRFGFGDSYKVPLVLSCTYYEQLQETDMSVTLSTPLPNIAVNRLNWSLFYPEEWDVKESSGDFSTYQHFGFRKIQHTLSAKQQTAQYDRLQMESTNQKMSGGNKELPLMGLSPNHLVGKRILIVNERPEFTVTFIESKTVIIQKMLWALLIVILVSGVIFLIFKRKK